MYANRRMYIIVMMFVIIDDEKSTPATAGTKDFKENLRQKFVAKVQGGTKNNAKTYLITT